MISIARAFKYLGYFFAAETKELREEAANSARIYYSDKPSLRTTTNFSAYKRGYINARCRQIAKDKLSSK
jgi:hypothetical protein